MKNQIALYPVSIYAVGFAGSFVAYGISKIDWLQLLAIILCAMFAGLGIVTFVNWFFGAYTEHLYNINKANSISKESELAISIAFLSQDQLRIYQHAVDHSSDEIYQAQDVVWIAGTPIPSDFVRKLISESRGHDLVPERNFSDGSADRLFYKTVVNYLINSGLAKPARGNRPATVIDWQSVLRILSPDEV